MHNENGSVEEKEDVELKRKYKKKTGRELRSRIAGLAIILIRAQGES